MSIALSKLTRLWRLDWGNCAAIKSDLHFKVPSKVGRLKFSGKAIVSLLSEGSKFIPNSNNGAAWENTVVDDQARKQTTVDLSTQFGTVAAEVVPSTTSFVSAKHEYDLDVPKAGLSSIPEAIEDIRRGKLVIVVDNEDRDNEGISRAFIVKHGTGIVCVSMKEEDLERLQFPLMVTLSVDCTMKLMTNNPVKYVGLKGYGLTISGRIPLLTPITDLHKRSLDTTNQENMGHV